MQSGGATAAVVVALGGLLRQMAGGLMVCAVVALGGPGGNLAQAQTHPNLKTWNWAGDDFSSAAWPNSANHRFGNRDWVADAHYAAGAVSTSTAYIREPGSKSIRAYLNSQSSVPANAEYDGNFRAEIRPYRWHEPVTLGTEDWHGFSYYFPESFTEDTSSRGAYFQLHSGSGGPNVSLDHYVPADHHGKHGTNLYLNRRWGDYSDSSLQHREVLPFSFEGGQWYDIVLHTIWDTEQGGRGLTEMWINGTKCYSAMGGNVYDAGSDPDDPNLPYGGTLKLGLYKWPWRDQAAIDASEAAGVTELEMFIGPVRSLRTAAGQHVGTAGYDLVAPRGLRPVPEPTAAALLALGGFLVWRWRAS